MVVSLPPLLPFPEKMILPSQVWIHLTEDQQHHLMQAIVLVCQELVQTLWHAQQSEVINE